MNAVELTEYELSALRAVPWEKIALAIEESDFTADELLKILLVQVAAENGFLYDRAANGETSDDSLH